jgi:YD repeat-containing protein
MSVSTKRFFQCLSCVLLLSILLPSPQSHADTVQYFYDELGRLTQVVNGSAITNYSYDEVGNILSVSNGSLTDTPSITSASQDTLLVGAKTYVEFTGQNLLSLNGISSLNGNITVNSLMVTPTKITALLTAANAGTDTLNFTFRDNNQTTYQKDINALAATVVMMPLVVSAQQNSDTTASISLYPPLSVPLTVGIRADNISVASVPSSVTIPAGGSADLPITTRFLGTSGITTLNNVLLGNVVVEDPVDGNGVAANPVSVSIEQAPCWSPGMNAAPPVSVQVALSPTPVTPSADITVVSVQITPSVQSAAPSVDMASPVSVQISPTTNILGPSVTVAPQVSVSISQ